MNAHTRPSSETDPVAEARRERWLERQMEKLDRLAEVGLQIAEAVGRQVEAAAPVDAATPDVSTDLKTLNIAAMAYARAARAVRMTLALQSRLLKAADETPSGSKASDELTKLEVSWMEDPGTARAHKRKTVQRIVRHIAQGAGLDSEACERFASEAAERLEDEELFDVMSRPTGDILAQVCRDLGLDPDWGRLAQEAWAREEIEAKDPNSPFRARRRGSPPRTGQPWITPAAKTHPPPLVPAQAGI